MQRLARLGALAAVVAVPAAGAASPAQIAFKLFPGERQAIMRFDQAGGNPVELTLGKPRPSEFGAFSWSSNGSRLVYASDNPAGLGGDIYSLSAEGTDLLRLTSNSRNDHPAWSPRDSRIAFVHTGADYLHREIWLIAADGSNPHPITNDAGEKYPPHWSPDGSQLLYGRYSGGSYWVFVVDGDTGQLRFQTPGFGGVWSPDGSRIAILTAGGIDVVNADGTGGRRTLTTDGNGPAWSPDGSRITFFRTHCVRIFKGICGTVLGSVFVVGANGGGERRLTGPIGSGPGGKVEGFPDDGSMEPSWWPDGSRLFYREQGYMRVMNADGTCEQHFGPIGPNMFLGNPAWRPGSMPSLPPLTCADLRVRTVPARQRFARRGAARLHVTIENDGDQTATGLTLTLRIASGRGRVRHPFDSCLGTRVVRCDLAPLVPGRERVLSVAVTNLRPHVFQLEAKASATEVDSDERTNVGLAYALVFDCDILGTDHADRLSGTKSRDKICGLGGSDVIAGGSGRDTIMAGAGDDTIFAGDGQRDVIDCDSGRDRVVADDIDRVDRDCERVVRRRPRRLGVS